MRILEYRLLIPNGLDARTYKIHSHRALPPLLLASKETNVLAMDVWTKNKFSLLWPSPASLRREAADNGPRNYEGDLRMLRPRLSIATRVRTLEVDLLLPHQWFKMLGYGDRRAWDLLIMPAGGSTAQSGDNSVGGIVHTASTWQLDFPRVRDLTIILTLGDTSCISSMHMNRVPEIAGWFRQHSTHLSANRVVVKVMEMKCGGYSTGKADNDVEVCPHGCAENIAKGLESLVQIRT
ncbi:hypothetical protein BDW02DRAFT_184882 [Decorospora gaudefroyi]|uniref:Uncharacterized protein n=1 Tax=Decorospora gaudefroyi TaxID=184978 RepID=A0A6A5JWP6_9PLEO|nr:hypothetical protein BDW02DRAFT_184882 [Decorospora gaudefroyi]